MRDLFGIVILSIGGFMLYKALKKPVRKYDKRVIGARKTSDAIKKRLDAEWNYFNNIESGNWNEVDNTIQMINAKNMELSAQIRRERA